MSHDLAGKPLSYLIGAGEQAGTAGRITEVAFDVDKLPPNGIAIAYCNLFDELNTGRFPPYRTDTETARQYGEGVIDATGPGFEANLREQFTRRKASGFVYAELDNADAYSLADVLRATALAESFGLRIVAKNPMAMQEDATQILAHPNVYAVIVEADDKVTAGSMDAYRHKAGKPNLPVRFVSFSDQRAWAQRIAAEITTAHYADMAVTYDSASAEYGGQIENVLLPITNTDQQVTDTTTQTTPLDVMRSLVGTQWSAGPPSPTILSWLEFIASRYPQMRRYINDLEHGYEAWCAITVAYCVARCGMQPPFGETDLDKFAWVDSFQTFGTPATNPQPNDIVIVKGGGIHHITLFVRDNGNGTWTCLGGNQSHQVKESNFSSRYCTLRRPAAAIAVPLVPTQPHDSRFPLCIPYVLVDEGGNDDDPRDPGGRTSRGITQREYDDPWRKTHPGLPADVFDAPQDTIIAIYRQEYWDKFLCDQLPAGVDYALFDYVVNSGPGHAVTALQALVGTTIDAEMGPDTLAAVAQHDALTLINQLCDQRLRFLQGLGTWSTFGHGWTNRITGVRKHALAMAGTGTTQQGPIPVTPDTGINAALARLDAAVAQIKSLDARMQTMEQKMSSPVPTGLMPTTTTVQPQINPQQIVDVLTELSAVRAENAKILAQVANKQPPDLSGLLTLITHGSVWGYVLTAILGHLGAIGGAAVGIPPTGPVVTSLLTGTGLSAGIELLKRIFPPKPIA